MSRAATSAAGVGEPITFRSRCHAAGSDHAATTLSRDVAWAGLASDLGYADQAHLTREFTAMIGMPPARYAHA